MSFNCVIEGKGGVDLLEKYGIQHQLLGIARSTIPEEYEDYEHCDLSEIRRIFCDYSIMCGESITKEQSQNLIARVQEIVYSNLSLLKQNHCEFCKCPDIVPKSWDIESAKRFISIPIDEVYKAYGGY